MDARPLDTPLLGDAGPLVGPAPVSALEAAYARLDADQRHVAEWTPADGNVRVVAAAGSGKTESSTILAARLVAQGIVAPERLVVTTFSRKAAQELMERLSQLLPPASLAPMRVGTFHALALRSLKAADPGAYAAWGTDWAIPRCVDMAGAKRAPGVPSVDVLWRCAVEYGKMPGTNAESLRIDGADAASYARACDLLRAFGYDDPASTPPEAMPKLDDFDTAWQLVIDSKRAMGAWDFADLLAAWRDALKARSIPDRADVVIVDEAQDNSRAQLDAVRYLVQDGGKVVLTGDLRQCVHRWRGAYPELFAQADRELGAGTRQIRTNYRSLSPIVELGNRIAAGRSWSLGDPSRAHRGAPAGADAPRESCGAWAGVVSVWGGFPDDDAEAAHVAAAIREDVEAGADAGDFAVLCRTNAALGVYHAALTEAKIPCVIVGGSSIFSHREVETFLCYLILSERDAYNAMARVVNYPKRYLGQRFVEAVRAAGAQPGASAMRPLVDTIRAVAATLPPGSRRGALDLAVTIERLRAVKEWERRIEAVENLLITPDRKSRAADSPDEDRPGLYRAAATIARKFDGAVPLYEFSVRCNENALTAQEGEGVPGGRVTLSTVHRSKGLGFKAVYVSASNGLLPHVRAMGEIEDERRLFYVAVTRARDRLVLLWNRQERGPRGMKKAGPSPFLDAVPRELWIDVAELGVGDAAAEGGVADAALDALTPRVIERYRHVCALAARGGTPAEAATADGIRRQMEARWPGLIRYRSPEAGGGAA